MAELAAHPADAMSSMSGHCEGGDEAAVPLALQKPSITVIHRCASAFHHSCSSTLWIKPMVLSGFEVATVERAMLFPENHQVLSGSALGVAETRGAALLEGL